VQQYVEDEKGLEGHLSRHKANL